MTQTDSISKSDLESLVSDTFLQSVIYYGETDSTNTRATELLATDESFATPCLVYAENQIAGRGRGANRWWSAEGSLTFSVVVDFREIAFSAEKRPLLPLLTGMAILRTGQQVLPTGEFHLKWPNDVYLADRKLAGILIEVPSQSSHHAVIGVGLNVNNQFSQAPQELLGTRIALADESETTHDRLEILRTFMLNFEDLVKSFAAGKDFLSDWPRYCLLTDKEVTLQTGSDQVTGICQGVDAAGALLLKVRSQQKRFFGGVVQSWS